MTVKVLAQVDDFRFIEKGVIELNGKPDYRLQVQNWYTKAWRDAYLFDNGLQLQTAMCDLEYAKWLLNRPCYIEDDE